MIDGKKVVALIPARGGSKRLPRKNILPLAGKPLISWTIEAASTCLYIDEVIVSTDDQEIMNVAVDCGAKVPELRPESLSSDQAKTEDVVLYTLDKFAQDADILVLLQPTSPLRQAKHIEQALDLFKDKDAFSIVSVTACEHSPLWSNILPEDHCLGRFISDNANKRSQELDDYYRLNGAIYIFDVSSLKRLKKLAYTDNSYAYIMSNKHSIDIDTQLDFDFASFILTCNHRI
ncbi:CMP-N-acetlyneuraminic acid synthetase [Vibrio sp. UCD-FRSSP16_10]|uniref:acylneuraminate cytidylyltransferase family protein n=1 Tax=unclassified Vibrio TaxID=2614977 RepID=UPI0007FEAB14|nr:MULTISPECIES: acylneuraminate cytidylyltransferase family protein [unclassified Vibrio]OBT10102.1 CMP-N-acetlyneuraminic acid synthetase [Vibrio sp. UCD-FRSSP16_30]OBT18892.1 CMP-N-acetlyneuraminic acid synthetase [Vibrio sp. UCD-FRSSP16_10]